MANRPSNPPAPAITLTAVGSGRRVALNAPGVATVLICFTQETQSGIAPVEAAVRARWPSPTDVLVAHVVDLHKVPGLFRKVAEGILAGEYKKTVEGLTPGQEPYEHVVILPDWEGAVAAALALDDLSKTLAVVILDDRGCLLGTYQGPEPATEAVRLMSRAAGL